MALCTDADGQDVACAKASGFENKQGARGRRAISSQMGWPDGASAEWPIDRPSASPTTCEVAAVPRNWQPPPGDPQAHSPSSAASQASFRRERNVPRSSGRDRRLRLDCEAASRRPAPARRQIVHRGESHHHRRQALVAGRHAEHAASRGQ